MTDSSPTSHLQVAVLSDPLVPGKKRKVKVLEEEHYVQQLEEIVERDFFPDLKALRSHSQSDASVIPVTETPVFTGLTSSASCQETIRSETTTAAPETGQSSTSNLSLGKFLNKYTGEDNASFQAVMTDIQQREKVKYEWMFLNEKEGEDKQKQQLALPDIETQAVCDQRTGKVLTWPFKNKNSVMFSPEGADFTYEELQLRSRGQNGVVLENTRFTDNPFDEMEQRTAIRDAAIAQAQAKEGKIGPDGKVITAPKVGGYAIVPMTPTPSHVLSDASPLMTWGQIDGTPVRVNSGTPFRVSAGDPSFRMPQTPAREELAHSLADSVAKKHRDKRKRAAELALTRSQVTGKSSQDQLSRMSPAAQRLATKKLGVTRSSDPKLLASYTPDQPSFSPSPRTPVSSVTTPCSRTSVTTPIGIEDMLNLRK